MDLNAGQPDPIGKGREITPLVIEDLKNRAELGRKKYGELLRAFNGRHALVDAYQEALDLVQYLRQALEESDGSEDPSRNYMVRMNDSIRKVQESQTPPPQFTALRPMTAREFLARQEQKKWYDAWAKVVKEFPWHKYQTIFDQGESVAQEAHRIVLGDRGADYGHPIFDMTRTADMLTSLLRDKLRPGARLEAEDIAQAMICVKQSRERNKHKRDNQVDTAGYALTKEMMAEWRAANPGVDPRDVFPEGV